MKKRLYQLYRVLPHALFVGMLVSVAVQADYHKDIVGLITLAVIMSAVEVVAIRKRKEWSVNGIVSIVFGIVLLWSAYPLLSGRSSFLFPPPQRIAAIFVSDALVLVKSVFSSLWLLAVSFLIALALGIGIGVLCGRYERLQNVVLPIAKVLSPVPSLIYAPYVVAIMPNFTAAAIFIITSGLFWCILINVIVTLQRFDQNLKNAAEVLNLGTFSTIVNIYLPYCMPSLFNTLAMQISNAFMLLIGAELMGMDSGLGWYVKYNSDFSDYIRVIAGFVVIGVIIAIVNSGLDKIRAKVILWQEH